MVLRLVWVAVLLIVLCAGGVSAREGGGLDFKSVEQLYLDDIHPGPGGERVVDLYIRALTRAGVPVRGLRPSDLEIWEDAERIDPDDVIVQPLQATGRGVAAVLAIDASGTMRGEPFERAKEAALTFLERLQPEDRVAVILFAENVRVAADFKLSRAETRLALRNLELEIESSQHTLLRDAAYQAIELIRRHPGLPRRSFLILFSDGKDQGSDRKREQVIAAASGSEEDPQVLIFSIGYARFGGGGLEEMRRLAAGTGGQFLEAVSMVHLRDFFDAIASQMLSSYVVRFPTDLDGEPHEIRVKIERVSAPRATRYPVIAGPPWAELIGLAGLLAVVGVFLLSRVRRTAGRLSIVSGAKAGTVLVLKKGKTRIGSLDDNDIVLPLNTVSRYHAEIITRGRKLEIRDLRSKNGTRVNGQVVSASPLQPGDKIVIADVELVYER